MPTLSSSLAQAPSVTTSYDVAAAGLVRPATCSASESSSFLWDHSRGCRCLFLFKMHGQYGTFDYSQPSLHGRKSVV